MPFRSEPDENWMNAAESAIYLDLTPAAIYQAYHRGLLPSVGRRRLVRFNRASLDAYRDTRATAGNRQRKHAQPEPLPLGIDHHMARRGWLGNGWQDLCTCSFEGQRAAFLRHLDAVRGNA